MEDMVLLAVVGILAAERLNDPVAIVRRLANADRHNMEIARQYTFVRRSEERELDGLGTVRKTESKTFDVSFLYGRPYSRLIAKDDKPLPEKDAAMQEEKFRKEAAKRQGESEAERRRRKEEELKRVEEFRKLIAEIEKAYYLRLDGVERLDGREVYRVSANPRPDYNRLLPPYSMLSKMRGTMWVDADEFQLAKVDAEVIDTMSLGLVLARVSAGTRLHFEQTRVNGEVWLPRYVAANFDGRLGLVKRVRAEMSTTWKDFRKFQTDSRIVDTGTTP